MFTLDRLINGRFFEASYETIRNGQNNVNSKKDKISTKR